MKRRASRREHRTPTHFNAVQDRLYRVTRAAGPDHLIFIEDGYIKVIGCRFLTCEARKTVVFSRHYYTFNAKSGIDQQKDEFALESLRQRQISQVHLIRTKTRRRSWFKNAPSYAQIEWKGVRWAAE